MTTKLRKIPLFGTEIQAVSDVVTNQRRVNCYYDVRPDAEKSRINALGTPGLTLVSALLPLLTEYGPMRGMYGGAIGSNRYLYLVAGGSLIVIYGIPIPSGTFGQVYSLSTSTGLVSIAANPTQIMIVDGLTAYTFNVAAQTLTPLNNSPGFPYGAKTITFLNSFFVCEQPNSQTFWVSNSGDGTTWQALAFAAASQYSDTILAVDNLLGMLVIFSTTHMEFWTNVGASPEPFQYIANSANQYGLAAIFSRAHIDYSIIFLTISVAGGVQVAMCGGYTVEIISTNDIDTIIQAMPVVSDATAFTYQVGSHKFYQINFPTGNRSLLYDTTTKVWSEVQTGVSDTPIRHAGNISTVYNGVNYIADYQSANVYTMNPNEYTDNGTPIQRELVSRHVLADFNRLRCSSIYLDMETGVGLTTGQGSNPLLMLQTSRDNGRTWSYERTVSLGAVGKYKTRAIFRRIGRSRDFTFKFKMTDPVKFVVTAGAAVLSVRK